MDEKDAKKNSNQGKGKGKNKKLTISLTDFVNQSDSNTQPGFTAVPTMRWADMAQSDDDENDPRKNQDSCVVLPNAPKSVRGPDIDLNKVPTDPPFICYLSNLPFDSSADDIQRFFKELRTDRIELIRDQNGKPRGQAAVEFPDRKTLIDAFTFNNDSIKNRTIKLSLQTYEQERENRGRYDNRNQEDNTASNWRAVAGNKPANFSNNNYQSTNRSYQQDNSNHFGNNRNYSNRNSNNYGGGDSTSYDRDNNSNRNYNNRSYNNRNNYNNQNNYQQNEQSNDIPSEPPRERVRLNLSKPTKPRPELVIPQQQQHTVTDEHQHHRTESESSDARRSLEPEKPVERKRLVLLPPSRKENTEPTASSSGENKSSIFGDAKPVDTTKRLQEIEAKKREEEAVIEEQLEKQGKDLNNRSGNREFNSNKRLSDSGSHGSSQHNLDHSNNRPHYQQQNSNDSSSIQQNRGGNRYNRDNDGYRKAGNNRNNNRNLNSRDSGNRYERDNNYQNNNYNQRDYNKRNYNRQQNNNWNNDQQIMNKKEYDERPQQNNRYNRDGNGQNRINRDRNSDGNFQMNKFNLLKEGEMD